MLQLLQGPGPTTAWAEVCTALGSKQVLLSDEGSGPSPAQPAEHLLQHCPSCAVHVTDLGMPPSSLYVPAILLLRGEAIVPMLSAPRTLFAWVAAQPRAPPALS